MFGFIDGNCHGVCLQNGDALCTIILRVQDFYQERTLINKHLHYLALDIKQKR